MPKTPLPFSDVSWTPELASALADASAALGRLDARISASPVAPAWRLRAAWMGYSAALRLQRVEIDEIDVFCALNGLRLPKRPIPQTIVDSFVDFEDWRKRLAEPAGRHWREGLHSRFKLSETWGKAPALIRALDLLEAEALADGGIDPWLDFPVMLRRLGVTMTPLPCLALGDGALRHGTRDRYALLMRLLKAIAAAADEGLARLRHLESWRHGAATVMGGERRPGALAQLVDIAWKEPVFGPRALSERLAITVSGAGKVLERARGLDLLVEVEQRGSWRVYVTTEMGICLGLAPSPAGRPQLHPSAAPAVDQILAGFDAEMAEIDAQLAKLGVR